MSIFFSSKRQCDVFGFPINHTFSRKKTDCSFYHKIDSILLPEERYLRSWGMFDIFRMLARYDRFYYIASKCSNLHRILDTYEFIAEEGDDSGKLEFLVPFHYAETLRTAVASGDFSYSSRSRRLAQEIASLSTSLPLSFSSSVFLRCDENRLDIMKVLNVYCVLILLKSLPLRIFLLIFLWPLGNKFLMKIHKTNFFLKFLSQAWCKIRLCTIK